MRKQDMFRTVSRLLITHFKTWLVRPCKGKDLFPKEHIYSDYIYIGEMKKGWVGRGDFFTFLHVLP